MECNRDEALRAKSIAEGKLEKKDFAGAKKFALKAQTLYPGLDGMSQMLTALDVYVSAENKISGEVDWYGVLGVNPSADDERIRKQYHKFALLLHPDKNKSVGADGAFKLISEAWTLLSDKVKRLAYNQKRNSKGFQQKFPMHNDGPSTPSANGRSTPTSIPKTHHKNEKAPRASAPTASYHRTDTFWTICHRCKMHYEYLKMYRDSKLICPNCKEAFMASETAPPTNYCKVTNQVLSHQQQSSGNPEPSQNVFDTGTNGIPAQKSAPCKSDSNSARYSNHQRDPVSGIDNVGNRDPSIAAKAVSVIQHAQDKLKRAYIESHTSAGYEAHVKMRKPDNVGQLGMDYNMAHGHFGTGNSSARAGSRIYDFFDPYHQPSIRDFTPVETRDMLMMTARKEILKKKKEWQSETIQGNVGAGERATKNGGQAKKHRDTRAYDDETTESPVLASIQVPDPDFHDFDLDRTESSFGDNEVWAAYDDNDGMPRFYALVNRVISRQPFKVRISWIKSKSNREFSTLDWVGSGFCKTCGYFWVGKYETCEVINAFSHKVNWSKGPHGSILLLPKKGDVWAIYKNWSPHWNKNTPDEVVRGYQMVTVLDDYNQEQGTAVAPLVKVAGFRTIFRTTLDPLAIKKIPKEETFRFSHQVPYHILTGQEAENAPKGCLELDPAAISLDLIQVTIEDGEVPASLDRGNINEQVL